MARKILRVDGLQIAVTGRFVRTARLVDEHYTPLCDPTSFVKKLEVAGPRIDILTFVQELDDPVPHYGFTHELEPLAVLEISSFKHWMDKKIRFKARNKFRKSLKSGLDLRIVPFSEELLKGIKFIYDETPLRQGKKNWHYQKDLATLKAEHETFLDRSDFIGAYFSNELVGFAKVTHSPRYSIIMNIVSKITHRDKAPTNALIAKTIEIVADRNIRLLNYGVWGRRGLNEFKISCGFERVGVPRYFVPLTPLGQLVVRLGLHGNLKDSLPESWVVRAAEVRTRWNEWRLSKRRLKTNVEQ